MSAVGNSVLHVQKTIESVPDADYVARFDILNTTFELYTHR